MAGIAEIPVFIFVDTVRIFEDTEDTVLYNVLCRIFVH